MTAPKGIINRIWPVDRKVAERFLGMCKPHEKGVKGTNRKISDAVVNAYAFEMLADRWKFTQQGFGFFGFIGDGTGEMKDGQHRCLAIVQAATVGATVGDETLPPNPDIFIDVAVMEGLDEDSWLAMDIGRRKVAADFLAMDGEVNTNVLAGVISLCYSYENGGGGAPFARELWNKNRMTPAMRQDYLDQNSEIREAVYEGARLNKIMKVTAAASGYYLALKAGVDPKIVGDFMDSLASGTGPTWEKGNPVFTFREMLIKARSTRRDLPREEQLALFIKSLNAYAKGLEIHNLSYKTRKSTTIRHGEPTIVNAETFPRFTN